MIWKSESEGQAMSEAKTCKHCRHEYPLTDEHWYRHSNTRDGFRSWCKECCRERDRAHAARRVRKPPPAWRDTCGRGHHSAEKRAAADAEAAIEIERLQREQRARCAVDSATLLRQIDAAVGYSPAIEAMLEAGV